MGSPAQERGSHLFGRMTWALGVGYVLFVAYELIEVWRVGSQVSGALSVAWLACVPLGALGPWIIATAWINGDRARRNAGVAMVALWMLVLGSGWLIDAVEGRLITPWLERAEKDVAPLVAALEEYTETEGRAPVALRLLSPRYVSEIPKPGVFDTGTLRYERPDDAPATWQLKIRLADWDYHYRSTVGEWVMEARRF